MANTILTTQQLLDGMRESAREAVAKLPDGYLRELASVDRFSIGIGGAMKAMLVLAAQEKLAADA